jgi:arylsulfatase B
MRANRNLALNLLTVGSLLLRCVTATNPQPPHIVFLMVDDWGYADVGYRGNPEAVTPNIDGLVAKGVRLDRAYTFKYCSPSRSAFQTGRNPISVNVLNLEPWCVNTSDPVSGFAGIPIDMTGIAEKMGFGGYYTAAVGKWDVGMASPAQTPLGRGFNESLGYFTHANDYWNSAATLCGTVPIIDLWDTASPALGQNNSFACSQSNQAPGCVYEDDLFTNRVLNIIAAHDPAQPLFLYWAPHIAHVPLEVPQAYVDKFSFINTSSRQLYMAMINYVDDQVGRVVTALTAKGMWNNTLWVSSADNGGPVAFSGANNFPLKVRTGYSGYLKGVFCLLNRLFTHDHLVP